MKRAVSLLLAVCLVAVLIVFCCTSAFAASGFTVEFAGSVCYGAADDSSSMTDLGSGRYAFTMADYQFFPLSKSYSFSSGSWYSGQFLLECRVGLANEPVSVTCTLSYGNYSSVLTGSCVTDHTGYGVCYINFDFSPTESFTSDRIYLDVSVSGIPDYGLGTVRSFYVSVASDGEHQSSIIGGKIDSAASNILSGEGLSGTSGVDDSPLSGTASGMAGAEGAIDDALGEGGLDGVASRIDSVMDVELNDSILASFSAINTLFTRIVDTLDLTIVLTFLLVFALAMYVVGRRVS